MHSRHVVELSDKIQHPEHGVALEMDKILAVKWLAERPGRSLLGIDFLGWAAERGWTKGHRKAVAAIIQDELAEQCAEAILSARARMSQRARDFQHAAEAAGEYSAAVSALRVEADILLPKESDKQQVNVQVNNYVVALPPKSADDEQWAKGVQAHLPHQTP